MTSQSDDGEPPERLFLAQMETIERAIRYVCRRGSMREADVEDFGSYVKLKLIDNDYAIIRKHDRRASFGAYIFVVMQRLLLDYRIAQWGKWHASAEAKRLGELAVTIEVMVHRDGRAVDEVFPALLRRWPDVTRADVDRILDRLPLRTRVRTVPWDVLGDTLETMRAHDEPESETRRLTAAARIENVVRSALSELDIRDRLIIRLRFDGGMTVAEISRVLKTEQKPLYRRLQRALALLRRRLEDAGLSAADAEDVLMSRRQTLDFGLGVETHELSGDEEGV